MAKLDCLIFDLGGSNGRAVVAGYDGRRFSLEVAHRFDNRPVTAAGTVWWDLLRLYSELEIGIQKATKASSGIASLGVDTWGVDFGLIDEAGRMLGNPVHYRDSRRNSMPAEVYTIIPPEELLRLTGYLLFPFSSLFSLYAMKKDGAPELERAHRFLMMPDLFHYLLSGVAVNEYTEATTSLAYSMVGQRWERSILERLGISPDLFSPPVLPGTRIGALTPAVCRELEVKPIPVIAPATHDTASAEAGIPVGKDSGAWAFLSIGTWGVVGMETPAPLVNERVFASGFGNEGRADGGTFLAENVTGLWIAQQCRQKWTHDSGEELAWEEIVRRCLAAPALRSLINVDDPAFAAVNPDVPGLIAAWCAKRGMPGPSDPGQTARCVYESLVLKFRSSFEKLADLTGRRIECIHMVGGGTQNEPLCQWTADATGIPVRAGPTETTVAGNLIMQLKGLGEITTLAEGREIVGRSSTTRMHLPGDRGPWDAAYARWRALAR
jgi:rhamnulokinase